MARGWESKAVEAQQEAADTHTAAPTSGHGPRPMDSAHSTLMLARTRALADLQLACVPAHRAMLEGAIATLDLRIAAAR
jgi:hypothetical protein